VVYTNSFTPPDPHPSVFSQALVSGFLDKALVITPVFIMPEDGLKDFTKTMRLKTECCDWPVWSISEWRIIIIIIIHMLCLC